MKELSIEEKAKAYDEAIYRVKHFLTVIGVSPDDDLSWELARENSWKDEDFEKFDKEFEDKDWFNACCKDCKYRKMVYRGVKTRCVILYEQKTAEKRCMKVARWLEENKK